MKFHFFLELVSCSNKILIKFLHFHIFLFIKVIVGDVHPNCKVWIVYGYGRLNFAMWG
jgi:hypothetical protein